MPTSHRLGRFFPAPAILLVLPLMMPTSTAAQTDVRIVQTNSAGDNLHIIDAVTNRVVGEVTGIERAHGAAPSPDGRWIYVANESDDTVDVVDVARLRVIKQIPLSGHPNNIAITPDGRKVYVAIARVPGALDVIDTGTNEISATISVHGGVHNTYVTPDGKYGIAGMIGARNITVVDTKTDMPEQPLDLQGANKFGSSGTRSSADLPGEAPGDHLLGSRDPSDGVRHEHRWIDATDLCAALELQWLRRAGFRDA